MSVFSKTAEGASRACSETPTGSLTAQQILYRTEFVAPDNIPRKRKAARQSNQPHVHLPDGGLRVKAKCHGAVQLKCLLWACFVIKQADKLNSAKRTLVSRRELRFTLPTRPVFTQKVKFTIDVAIAFL